MSETPLQNLDQLEEALERAGLPVAPHAEVLDRTREFCARYSALERELIGDVPLRFPAYLLELEIPEDPLAAGEILAARERERLALGQVETGSLARLLDREGLKVYRPPFPPGGELEGFFLFDAEAGPVLVVDGTLPPGEADFVFGRLFAHFLVDNDPYRIRLVLRGDAEAMDAVQARARSFAGAFLVSREGLETYLAAAGLDARAPLTVEIAWQLCVYFEVAAETLLTRLLALGRVDSDAIRDLLPELRSRLEGGVPGETEGPGVATAVPERFLRLALEAHAREQLTLAQLAEHLECDAPTARRLADRFRLEEGESVDPMKLMEAATHAAFRHSEAAVDLEEFEGIESGEDGGENGASSPEEEENER